MLSNDWVVARSPFVRMEWVIFTHLVEGCSARRFHCRRFCLRGQCAFTPMANAACWAKVWASKSEVPMTAETPPEQSLEASWLSGPCSNFQPIRDPSVWCDNAERQPSRLSSASLRCPSRKRGITPGRNGPRVCHQASRFAHLLWVHFLSVHCCSIKPLTLHGTSITEQWVATWTNERDRPSLPSGRGGLPLLDVTFGFKKKRPVDAERHSVVSGQLVGVRQPAIGQTCFFGCISTLNPYVLLPAIGECHLKLLRCPGPRSLAWVVCASQMWGERCV